MTLSQRPRKLLLAVHLVSSIGWVGALTAFLVLALAGLLGGDDRTVRAAYIAMDLVTWFAIVPLAFVSLLSGIVQALATPWGLIRNYWVLFKLVIVVTATYMLIGKTGPIGLMADAAVAMPLSADSLLGLRLSILGHAVGGLLVLFWVLALGVYKPRGITPFGRGKQLAPA